MGRFIVQSVKSVYGQFSTDSLLVFFLDKHIYLRLSYLRFVSIILLGVVDQHNRVFAFMRLTKNYHNILYAIAFIYLVMCPAVHQLGDIVRHDLTLKIGDQVQQNNFKKNFNGNPFNFSNSVQTADFAYIKTVCVVQPAPSSYTALDLSSLSTVRLIL